MMNRRYAPLAALLLLLPAACGAPQSAQPPLAGAAMGGAFALTAADGKRVTDAQFAGRYRLVYFGYTFCPDVCPLDVARLMRGFALLEKRNPALAAQIAPIFISVDPARDTPAVVGEFTRAFHPKLLGLTGTPAEIAVIAKRYGVFYERAPGGSATQYSVNHSNMAVLYGRKGEPLATIPQDGPPEVIADEIERWAQ